MKVNIAWTTGETITIPRRTLPITVATATGAERQRIYRIRHDVYALELGQHAIHADGRLRDSLDEWNTYLVAKAADEIVGFISITSPRSPALSIDKYFSRKTLPFQIDDELYEVRLLTVLKPQRGRELATLLMYAAFRWVEAHGGTRIVAIGRREVVDLYLRVGLQPLGLSTRSGAVTYDLLVASVADLRERLSEFSGLLTRLEEKTNWLLAFPFRRPAACFHGGAFFQAVGERFDDLKRRERIINADVLDAWFPPAPGVLAALDEHMPWLLSTSPPAGCEGLVDSIARARGVASGNILPGAGSSDLIFRALRHWLDPASHVLILDPTYGEYAHVLDRVIGCTVDRLVLKPENQFDLELARLQVALADEYDLVVIVNPNSPTGRHVPGRELARALAEAPLRTRVWVDETYVEYAGPDESLEPFAVRSENVILFQRGRSQGRDRPR